MGAVGSRADEGSLIYFKEQSRLTLKSLVIFNGHRKVVLSVSPDAYPATRFTVRKDTGDDTPVSYVQDPESSALQFLPRLDLEDELDFRFTFIVRQTASAAPAPNAAQVTAADTHITGLTFAYASNTKELDTLVTREFHADPNLHKNSNVQFLGDYSTSGSPSIEFEWLWRWKPPKASPDRGGGWRHSCSFLEYDSRAHRLNTLASFGFWVHRPSQLAPTPLSSPGFDLTVPIHRNQRMPSSQSYQSAVSDTEDLQAPPSPHASSADFLAATMPQAGIPVPLPIIDVNCQRPGEDMSSVEDGPVFRATMKSLEQKTGNMRVHIKKVLKKAEAAQQAQAECNATTRAFLTALQEASASNASAFKPALDHYFTKIAQRLLDYEVQNAILLQKQIIEPISRLYNLDIKAADQKKKDFDEESKDYYAYVSRYLGQRTDSLKEKKRAESDSKYQHKKRNFELKRFDYSSFMQDLHGGRKEQELLSQLTRYANSQAKSFLDTAKKVETLTPQLDALVKEVTATDKEYKLQRTEREEKRRNLEKNAPATTDNEPVTQIPSHPSSTPSQNGQAGYNSDTDLSRADSTSSQFAGRTAKALSPSNSLHAPGAATLSTSPGGTSISTTPSKFKGIRDLEERDVSTASTLEKTGAGQFRKEGLLWALSKPGSHIDPKGINKQAWHK
jgi:Arf-GAP with SH3 domain, ANK repeat and PH domain-containing protein